MRHLLCCILLCSTLAVCFASESVVEAVRGTVLTKSFIPIVEPTPDVTEEPALDRKSLHSQELYEKIPMLLDPQKGMKYRAVEGEGDDRKVIQNQEQLILELSRQLREQEIKASDTKFSEELRAAYSNNARLLRKAILQEEEELQPFGVVTHKK